MFVLTSTIRRVSTFEQAQGYAAGLFEADATPSLEVPVVVEELDIVVAVDQLGRVRQLDRLAGYVAL